MNYKKGSVPFVYLGLPVGANPKKGGVWVCGRASGGGLFYVGGRELQDTCRDDIFGNIVSSVGWVVLRRQWTRCVFG